MLQKILILGKNIKESEYIFFVNVIGKSAVNEIDKLFEHVYNDFKGYIRNEEINANNINDITNRKTLLPSLKKPADIIPHPKKLCDQINLIYRLIAPSVCADKKGSTLISATFLKIISNIFGIHNISIEECKRMIKAMNFDIYEKNKNEKKEFKHWFTNYYGYETPAEEQISYLAWKYINQYEKELKNDPEKCIKYINTLRITLNEAIEGLNKISKDFHN